MKKFIKKVSITLFILIMNLTTLVYAEPDADIGKLTAQTDTNAVANKFLKLVGALQIVGWVVLAFTVLGCGIKMVIDHRNERSRTEIIDGIKYIFIGGMIIGSGLTITSWIVTLALKQ